MLAPPPRPPLAPRPAPQPAGSCGPARGLLLLLAALLLAAVLAGCADEEEADGTNRRIEVYGLVLDWLLERERFEPVEGARPDDTPTVFVDHLTRQIELDVQVALVSRFEERYDLRFVDALAEAVDQEAPRAPARHGGVLVGLGAIPDTAPYVVRAEVYRDARRVEAFRFEVVRWGGGWVLRGEPEPVEPEGFVTGT